MPVQVVWYQYTAFKRTVIAVCIFFLKAGYWNQKWRKPFFKKSYMLFFTRNHKGN